MGKCGDNWKFNMKIVKDRLLRGEIILVFFKIILWFLDKYEDS